jgi:two-component system chemotaxis sensor kinase CheA
MDELKSTYIEEADELLDDLELTLLALSEKDPSRDSKDLGDLIDQVFRIVHTIKGSGAMFGFDDIVSFSHIMETVLDRVRSGIIPITDHLIHLSLSACDHLKSMVIPDHPSPDMADAITEEFIKLIDQDQTAGHTAFSALAPPAASAVTSTSETTFNIRFIPGTHIFKNGTNPVFLIEELQAMGSSEVIPNTETIPPLSEFDPEKCYLQWEIILKTAWDLNAVRDVFIFVEDQSEIHIQPIGSAATAGKPPEEPPFPMETAAPHDMPASASDTIHRQKPINSFSQTASTSTRVPSEKLDLLMNLVGELVTVQANLSQIASSQDDSRLIAVSETVERLTDELRSTTMSIRMLPASTLFLKFKRLIHESAKALGKTVAMTIQGGDTEMDKTVLQRLNDPLIHIIRNSIDHGIESPSVRAASGKPEQGMIHLSAEHSSTHVIIKIQDDGCGIDPAAIRRKAIERHLISPEAELSESDIHSLIFEPGFSTKASVNAVSGRGVGMDIVKNNIESLRGSIQIESEPNRGTGITLKLPLTLAIIDGLLVEVGSGAYVIPLSSIEECMERPAVGEKTETDSGCSTAVLRGEILPLIRLRTLFDVTDDFPDFEQIVIVTINNLKLGIVVDNIIGEHQTVIKSLGGIGRKADIFSGSTILADGSVALILDPHQLLKTAEYEEKRSSKHHLNPVGQ